MKLYKMKNYDEMSKKAATIIAAQVTLNPESILGLATGSSPLGIYKKLIEWFDKNEVSFLNTSTFNLDEYKGLSPEDKQSYFYYMSENFFKHVDILQKNIHIPNGKAENIDEECKKYDNLIESLGGADLQLLGIGHNGHIAFNEPDEVFSKGTNCVSLTESTIDANSRFFEKREDIPTKAFTVGIRTIMSAKKILLIASGKDKAEIMYKTFNGDITPKLPASILQLHPDVTVVGDEDALSLF